MAVFFSAMALMIWAAFYWRNDSYDYRHLWITTKDGLWAFNVIFPLSILVTMSFVSGVFLADRYAREGLSRDKRDMNFFIGLVFFVVGMIATFIYSFIMAFFTENFFALIFVIVVFVIGMILGGFTRKINLFLSKKKPLLSF